ncbi:MAG: hypothetical protein O7G87_06240, partial [bacterium]|nr:hypothetical protein [bacterium]
MIFPVPGTQGWDYRSGDQMHWADPGEDDGGWMPLPAWEEWPWLIPEAVSWTGVGWFRFRFRISREFRNRALGLLVFQAGASEIYLDGRLIRSFGRVGKSLETEVSHIIFADTPEVIPVRLEDREEHTVAVRFSNFWTKSHVDPAFPAWWCLRVSDLSHSVIFRDNRIRTGTVFQM